MILKIKKYIELKEIHQENNIRKIIDLNFLIDIVNDCQTFFIMG